MASEEAERRRSVRIKKPLIIQYAQDLADENTRKWDSTAINDISENGVIIKTMRQFLPQEMLVLFIKLPSRPLERVEIKGRVVLSEPIKDIYGQNIKDRYLTRIEFSKLKEEHRELIRSYIKWFSSKPA